MVFDQVVPLPPSAAKWEFVKEFEEPIRWHVAWKRRSARADEADMSAGVSLLATFDDSSGLLDTAYSDLRQFLADTGVSTAGGYEIVTGWIETSQFEQFKLEVEPGRCRLLAGDTEGIRRAVYYLIDELLRSSGPYLPLGVIERTPVVRTRISRCYFGPKNRPPIRHDILRKTNPDYARIERNDPEYRDELMDEIDYYSDACLSRFAREGINGLWITASFAELCRTDTIPEYGRDSEQRLEKLNDVVARCGRYGIQVYMFCVEPRGFGNSYKSAPLEILEKHPELAGEPGHFCTSSQQGLMYIDQAVRYMFLRVPGLGGLINLCVGEMPTHCCSGWLTLGKVECPLCSQRDPADVLAEVLATMEHSMHSVAPNAELIAWPYSQYLCWGHEATKDFAGQAPENVILQYNFESGGTVEQLGKTRRLDDYWLAYAGPSNLFRDCVTTAVADGSRVSAKLQVACALELATVPFIPVPGILYKKYKAIHELGVSCVMHCWLEGGGPTLMNKAACELSFSPLPDSPEQFLLQLAREDWGSDAQNVAKAWSLFQDAYENYPYARIFSYYSPMTSGPVWPLYLVPRDLGLSPSFRAGFGPNGDRIGECLMDEFSLEEALTLTKRMADGWAQGMVLLHGLRPKYSGAADRLRDIGVAEAVGLHLQCCYDILEFYYLRDELAYESDTQHQLELLDQLAKIVRQEHTISARLLELTLNDSRLGFEPGLESHIYFPEKLQWRMEQLEHLLTEEFSQIRERLQQSLPVFPEYTGQEPAGPTCMCRLITVPAAAIGNPCGDVWNSLEEHECGYSEHSGVEDLSLVDGRSTTWKACYDADALYITVTCCEPNMSSLCVVGSDQAMPHYLQNDCVEISIEPRRLWPCKKIVVNADGDRWHVTHETPKDYGFSAVTQKSKTSWSATLRIPWNWLSREGFLNRPIRLNISRIIPARRDQLNHARLSWATPHGPLKGRLMLGSDNPQDLGWLLFGQMD